MFQKKEVIYSETIGVCIVEDIVKLADNKKDTYNYYLLRSVYDKAKKAYIPVENHTVQLRNLITLQEAQALRDENGYEEKSEQARGEISYVIEKSGENGRMAVGHVVRNFDKKLSEDSESIIQND